ncbi:neurogenic locus notch homolog protein 1-like [Saccostrea echinata]|uniref:neurogenic locus notch homolog protein 1-like n=1 Tax=Saccostrea echinata TaxID=191078 RepID=UPI002A80F656|nr:neurogenic locus notch homolog protein 1-like [Saccostrea echinata]
MDLVLLQIFVLYTSSILADQCSHEPECHVFNWKEWASCTGVCGSQSQRRERNMCCSMSVSPHTIENCLKHCNLSPNFKLDQSKSCRICENGGTLNISSLSCKCDPYHKGDCCQDLVKCQDNPCKHGICTDTAYTFTCHCDRGYTGLVCDKRKLCSQGIVCKNGGTCVDGSIGFKCHCSDRYTGEFCERVVTTEQPSELRLPEWFPYLEYGLLSVVSLIGLMTLGCICLKCCRAFGVGEKKFVDDDDNDEERNFRKRKNVHSTPNHPKPVNTGIDF